MKRFFILVLAFLLGISSVRIMTDASAKPLTLGEFLYQLSEVDITFETTLEKISDIKNDLTVPDEDDLPGCQSSDIANFFALIWDFITLPFLVVYDLILFLASILHFFYVLIF